MALLVSCAPGAEPDARDASMPDASPRDSSVPDASEAIDCAPREVREGGACVCPASDVLCPTRGYARHPIPNVAGSGLPREARYRVEAELVHDEITGLAWERRGDATLRTWDDASARCEGLVLGGRDDFRLPGRIEWVTLLVPGASPAIDRVFEGVVADYHWTSSVVPFARASAYSVYLGAGETTFGMRARPSAYTRCVAGAPAAIAPQLEVRGDRVVDHGTTLEWEARAAAPLTWDAAGARCAAMDMRLPSMRELSSIVDETRGMPAIDVSVFGEASDALWTSTDRSATEAWVVDFRDGQTFGDRSKAGALPSRCVR